MSDLEYYEDMRYQEFLLSSIRKEICPPELIFEQFKIDKILNLVDFGMGLGFFTPYFKKYMRKDTWIWGIDYQQEILDFVLQKKTKEGIEHFTPLHIEKSDHPLLPEWIPVPDLVFSSMCLSTFADPGLAMDGLIRSMKPGGRLVVIDWAKADYDHGPSIKEKISIDKMKFLADERSLNLVKSVRVSEFIYGLEFTAGPEFVYGYYDLKEEE